MKRLVWILVMISLLLGLLPFAAQAANLEVEAKSALLMDVATGTVLFEQNSHEALAPASVTKVMTLLLIMEAIDSGKIRWEDTVRCPYGWRCAFSYSPLHRSAWR